MKAFFSLSPAVSQHAPLRAEKSETNQRVKKERKLEIKRVGERERKLDIVQDSLTLREIEGEVRMERMD